MGAAAYVGRVGGLAVALGVGTAIVTGQGVAVADDGSPSGSASSASSNESASSGSASDSGSARPSSAGAAESASAPKSQTAPTTPPSTTSTPPSAPAAPSSTQTTLTQTTSTQTTKTETTSTTSKTVAPGVVVSAQSTTGSSGSAATAEPTSAPAEPRPTEPSPTEPSPTVTPQPTTVESVPTPTPSPAPTVSPAPTAAPKPSADAATSSAGNASKDKPAAAPAVAPVVSVPEASPAALPKNKAIALDATTIAAAASISTVSPPVASVVVEPVAAVVKPVVVQPVAPPNVLTIVANAVSSVVDWMVSPFIGGGPASPAQTPVAWTLLAFVRREFENFVSAFGGAKVGTTPTTLVAATTTTATTKLALAATPLAAAAVANPINVPNFPLPGTQFSPSTSFVNWVTGNYQTGDPLMADTANRFGIWGTDVGVSWDNGMVDNPTTPYDEHQILMAFGDTFSGPNMTGVWRYNTLLRSSDTNLADGIDVPAGEWFNGNMFGGAPLSNPTFARPIITRATGLPGSVTLIPTAGISVPTPGTQFGVTQYVNFMSVSQWGAAGSWTTNYSGIAYSTDNGENFTIAPSSIRYNNPWSGDQNFQQGAFVRPGDGYVYTYGTPNGRQGAAYVSRVAEKDILDLTKYEYYSKGSAGGWFGIGATPAGWFKNNPGAATPVFGAEGGACGATAAGNTVSELSVQYNKQLKKYVTLYGDQNNSIVMRTSDTPQGGWSAAKVLMTQQPGGIYAPMMNPWSPSTLGTGSDLYWNLSLYSEYNVMLVKTDLTKV
jgi:hypothetical protein